MSSIEHNLVSLFAGCWYAAE